MLHDPDWFTAELAVDALSDLGDPQAIGPARNRRHRPL